MSLWTLTMPGLSIGPRIRTEGDRLVVRSHALGRILSLGAFDHEAMFDRAARRVTILEKRFWRRRATILHFGEIDHLDYDFRALPTSFTWLWQTADQLEEFSIHLVLRNPERRLLVARFQGEGSVETGLEGVLMDDTWVDVQGDQGERSRRLVRLLSTILGVTVGAPAAHIPDSTGRLRFCSACRRPSPPRLTKCQYCGGRIQPAITARTSGS